MSIYIAHRRRKTSNALDTLVLSEQECFQWTSESLVTTRWRFNVGEHWKPWERCRTEGTRDETHGRVQLHIDLTCVSRAWPVWGAVLCCWIAKRQSRWPHSVGAGASSGTGGFFTEIWRSNYFQMAAKNVPNENCNFSELARYFITKFCRIIITDSLHYY